MEMNIQMTKKVRDYNEILEEMKWIAKESKDGDVEMLHLQADDLLINFLKSLGYKDLARAYNRVDKWYA